MTTVSVLVPITIVDAMLNSGSTTIPEPDSSVSELIWDSTKAYKTGDTPIRTTTHQVYYCQKDEAAARATPLPESDPTYFYALKPTNRWAPFDATSNTQATATTSATWVLSPGFFNAIAVFGLSGAIVTITVKDAPGGNVTFGPTVYNIQEVPFDEYDYCWGQIVDLDRLVVSGIVPYPSAELTITVAAGAGVTVKCGMIAIGDLCSLVPSDITWAGPHVGAQAKPSTFSDIKVMIDGTVQIASRRSGTDLTLDLTVPKGQGDTALAILRRVLDVPCAVVGTDSPGFAGLVSFGLLSGYVTYDDGREVVHVDHRGLV